METNGVYFTQREFIVLNIIVAVLILLLCWCFVTLIRCWTEDEEEKEKQRREATIHAELSAAFLEDAEAFEAYRQMLSYVVEQSGVTGRNDSGKDG